MGVSTFRGYQSRYPNFDQVYQRWVRSDTSAEFKGEWPKICQEFDVDQRSWLYKMYEKCEHWLNCYLNDIF